MHICTLSIQKLIEYQLYFQYAKSALFADDMTLYIENLKDSTKKLQNW